MIELQYIVETLEMWKHTASTRETVEIPHVIPADYSKTPGHASGLLHQSQSLGLLPLPWCDISLVRACNPSSIPSAMFQNSIPNSAILNFWMNMLRSFYIITLFIDLKTTSSPKSHSSMAAVELPSMRCRLLLQKLRRLLKDDAVEVGPG